MSDSAINEILSFWFGDDEVIDTEAQNKIWFGSDAQLDQSIREQFGGYLEQAGRGDLDHWAETASGRMALIILLDQFSRNVHRGSALAFSFDEKARQICLEGLEQGTDRELRPIERAFFYLPLEHSESLILHDRCISCYEALVSEAEGDEVAKMQNYLDFAHMHRDIVVRFGRYPHRNKVLGRENTAEEQAYLDQSGQTFGQS